MTDPPLTPSPAEHPPAYVRLGEVHFPEPPFGGWTYRIPPDLEMEHPGIRIRVPLGSSSRVGFLVRIFQGPDEARLKDVIKPLDAVPLLNSDLLELTRWMSEYYLCAWGEALAAAVPSGLKPRNRAWYQMTTVGKTELTAASVSIPSGLLWKLLANGPVSRRRLLIAINHRADLLRLFLRRGWIEPVEQPPVKASRSFEIRWRWKGETDYEQALETLPGKARKLRQAVEIMRAAEGSILQRELSKIEKGLGQLFRKLAARGWVKMDKIPLEKLSALQEGLEETALSAGALSPAQERVVKAVKDSLSKGKSQTFLLHGVTSSGKTLTYLEVVEAALKSGRSAIVMVPEISLTPQLVGRFRRRFGDLAAATHSGLSPGERQSVWTKIRSGLARVVIGPRSAIFTPLADLGLVIIDEEHDESYKQDHPAPRYNGRDAAIYRAHLAGAVVLLGSATPDVVSYFNAQQGKFTLLELPERYRGVKPPEVQIVQWGIGKEGSLFSPALLKKLDDRLEHHEQIILLINRRAFSTFLRCPDCGEAAWCPNCDIALKYHRVGLKLLCHYCGYTVKAFDLCPKCRSSRVIYGGLGTQRVEKELTRLFPEVRLARMDLDTTRRPGAYLEMLSGFAQGKSDLLLGTQMVAKGHDFPGVTLVGVLAADAEWLRPDFRTVEKAFRLLAQASGRTGRSRPGEVVIQSWEPATPVLRWVQKQDYRSLYQSEIESRRQLGYPPFSRLVSLVISAPEVQPAVEASSLFRDQLEATLKNAIILGPVPPPAERLESLYRRRLLIKLPARFGEQARRNKETIYNLAQELEKRFKKAELRVIIDVDPVSE